jgi:hypothetical protein
LRYGLIGAFEVGVLGPAKRIPAIALKDRKRFVFQSNSGGLSMLANQQLPDAMLLPPNFVSSIW